MGLNTLATLIQKRGKDYANKSLDKEVIITEKLDVFRIMFEQKDNQLKFYKSDNTEIDIITRTLDNIWESALIEIPTIIGNTKLPEGIRFGVAYTPVERPLRIPYTNLPRYILTDMSKRKNNKVVESYDYKEITEWAGLLCMGRPPVIFEGKLNEEQKRLLIAYDTKQYDGECDTFSEMVTKTLKSSYSKEDIIEGIVIKEGKNLYQIISYEFDLLNESHKNAISSRDFYDIVLLSINDFMENYKFPKLVSESTDETYIEIVSDIFEKYCKTEKISKSFEPGYLESPQFGHSGNLNKRFIKNKQALKYIESSKIYEALYRVFLSSFRKYKKPYGLLTESVVDKFNSFVGIIADKTNEKLELTILNEKLSDNITVKALKRRIPNDIDNMRVIASVQRAFNPPQYNIPQGEKRVAIYLTSFKPFTSAQMTNIEQIHNKWNVPVLLAAVSNENVLKGNDFHLSDGVILSQMKSLSNFNKSLIPSYMMLNTWSLREIFQFCRPHYEPLLVITDTGKKSEMVLQLFYEEEIMGGKINVLDEFNIGEMLNKEAISAYRSIEDGNGVYFMEQTPKSIHSFYDNMINEFRSWEGAVLDQFEPTKYPEIK